VAQPRKIEPDYGRVVVDILRHAGALHNPGNAIERLAYLGDTRMLDGQAFENLCAVGGWEGWAFIGQDKPDEPPQMQRAAGSIAQTHFCLANRWSLLDRWAGFLEAQGFVLDGHTVVVIDLDKTAAGARGRNDRPIDEARLEGVRRTMVDLLGECFDEQVFRQVYAELNRPAYHPFTADNQDYLAYVCLMLGTPLFTFDALLAELSVGTLQTFAEFIRRMEARRQEFTDPALLAIHDEIWRLFQAGDPTPFKAFRRNEYLATAERYRPAAGREADSLRGELIALTREVLEFGRMLKERGALIFGLSDKPDEASFPTAEQAAQGWRPLHHLETVVLGTR
jgi:hypothetical protein